MRILILHDHVAESARADESDALVQAQAVREALQSLGHEVSTLALTLNLQSGLAALQQVNADVVFNLCESLGGQARLIHVPCDVLDAARIRYTGARAAAMMLTSNKLTAKQIMHLANVPTASWFTMDGGVSAKFESKGFEPGPFIIKAVWEHASVGLNDESIVHLRTPRKMADAIAARTNQYGGAYFAETYIDGREFNLALLADASSAPEVLPPCEIVFENYPREKPHIVNYSAKWEEHSFEYAHTPRRYDFPAQDLPLIDRMKTIAMNCWRLFDLHGYARVDFRVDRAGNPWVLEVNTNPCLSPDAGYAAALEVAGLSFPQAIRRILADVPSAG